MPLWTDAHNHLHDPRLGAPGAIISAMHDAGVECCIVNATREDDWEELATLARAYQDLVIPAFGIHPWHSHTVTDGWQLRLRALLMEHPRSSIGECGVDRWVKTPSIDIQLPVFLSQIRLSRELRRPLVIHCLKAWGALMDAFTEQAPPPAFLMHSYGGSLETARILLDMGAYFSFSGYFLQPRKTAVIDVFRQLPVDRILLETDAPHMLPPPAAITHPLPDGLNHPANLAAIGQELAAALGMGVNELAELTRKNASRCFGL